MGQVRINSPRERGQGLAEDLQIVLRAFCSIEKAAATEEIV